MWFSIAIVVIDKIELQSMQVSRIFLPQSCQNFEKFAENLFFRKTAFCQKKILNKKMASSFSCVLYVDNIQVGTLDNRVPISLTIPSVAVPVSVLPIFSEDGGFLTLQIANSTSNRDEVWIFFLLLIIAFNAFLFLEPVWNNAENSQRGEAS